jgi:homoserine O-acetyltransferase/O-succinyltransferase
LSSSSLDVVSQVFEYGSAESPFRLRGGDSLSRVEIAYETWGELNADKSNAILINHALSGSHHVLGYNPSLPQAGDLWQEELHQGWWEGLVGPGMAIDTDKFFVICPNYLGGCYGSTGPSSVNPDTGKVYGSTFPHIYVADQADIQLELIKHLGISQLSAVLGASVGGLIALTFATRHPEWVRNVISLASGFKTTVLNRLILFEQILAIENDQHFNGGDYYDGEHPDYGLALARMISHKTFVHLDAIEKRAKSEVQQDKETLKWYEVKDPFQSYMLYQGKKFVKRFDANTYLRIIDMWSRYDAVKEADADDALELFAGAKANKHKYLVFSIDSDFCFYPEEQLVLVDALEKAEVENMYITVHSDKGHDSFLLEPDLYSPHISFLLSGEGGAVASS